MIAHLDKRFGDLRKFLSEEKLEDDTIVVFMTDNGGTAGVKTFNAGLRAGKTTYYEGGHRVPCWIRWPNGKLGEPRDIATPTQNTDLLPTLCDLCGVAPPARDPRDAPYCGVSLASYLRGSQPLPDRMFVVQYGQDAQEVRRVRGLGQVAAGQGPGTVRRRGRSSPADAMSPPRHPERGGGPARLLRAVVARAGADTERVCADQHRCPAAAGGRTHERRLGRHLRGQLGLRARGGWRAHGRPLEHPGRSRLATMTFTLRRWPERAQVALGEKYEPSARSPANKPNLKTVGFPTIAGARIEIAGAAVSAAADPKATSASITANLPAGRTKLKAWFVDRGGNGVCGAFFVTVARNDRGTGVKP